MGPGSGTSSRSSVKMRGSGTSLSRLELENAGLRNELDSVLSRSGQDASGWGSGRLLTHGAAERSVPAVGGDERVEIKEILKMMVSGTQNPPKKCKMVMLRNGFFW